MKRRGVQLSNRHRRWFYSVTTLLFLSGAIWALGEYLLNHENTHSEFLGSLKSWSLKIHGAAAMAFLVELGILIPTHIKRAWQAHRNRANGVFLVGALAVLVITGYGLYYFGDEWWRNLTSQTHLILGLAIPVLLLWHIWLGRRSN